jgi:serine/threonine-protein kinase
MRQAPLPERFGRYEVEALIGEGSMGRVYRAFDPLSKRSVAVKILKPEYLTRDDGPEYVRRFAREARAAGQLDHPAIVRIFDVGENFFVMELLEGQTLAELLRARGGRLPHADLVRLLEPVAAALDYAHARGTIHRDVKPGNVMVLHDGTPRLMDFGVAHIQSSVMTAQGEFLGSPSYMAPEQIARSEASPGTDLFSLGVVAYEALTGARPFEGDSITAIVWSVVNVEPKAACSRNPELPSFVDLVLERALAKDPALRFPSARALAEALRSGEVDVTLPPLPRPEPFVSPLEALVEPEATPHTVETQDLKSIPPPPSRVPRAAIALLAGLGLVIALAVLRTRSGTPDGPSSSSLPAAPAPTRAALQVSSDPPGAQVFLDGQARGATPLHLADLEPRRYALRLAKAGYAPAELSLELPAGAPVPLSFSLQREEVPGAPAHAALVPPRPLQTDPAAYPFAARRMRLEGQVEATFTVDADGRTSGIQIVHSAGGLLDDAVVEAVRHFRYEPARRSGKPVAVPQRYRQKFVLE